MLAYMYNHMSWGWGILMMLGWVVLLGLFIALVFGTLRDRNASPSARELLDRRLAAGEISAEQYREARAALSGSAGEEAAGPPAPPAPPAPA